jgi:hypothetical protein
LCSILGKLVLQNGDIYEGDFVENEFSGNGTYTFASGDKYVGEFRNGRYNGSGMLRRMKF